VGKEKGGEKMRRNEQKNGSERGRARALEIKEGERQKSSGPSQK
jgi:hypothetical protein